MSGPIDWSKRPFPKTVIAPEGCSRYLTAGKSYVVREPRELAFNITDDDGDYLTCFWLNDEDLNGGDWIIPNEDRPEATPSPELLETLEDALAGWRYIRLHHGDLSGVGWDRVEEKLTKALAALNPKPVDPVDADARRIAKTGGYEDDEGVVQIIKTAIRHGLTITRKGEEG